MPPLLIDGLYLVLGFAILGRGAAWLVDGGVALAEKLSISQAVTGLTVVALGTSLPEVVVASLGTSRGEYGLALGTVLGSNIANIGLVLGFTGLMLPRLLATPLSLRESSWLIGSLGLMYFLSGGGSIQRFEGLLLFAAFIVYQILVLRGGHRSGEDQNHEGATNKVSSPWTMIFIGSLAIALGAYGVLDGGISLAEAIGVPPAVIGFTVLAVGTSLPELAAGIVSALKGHAELGLGNVVGSNIFNTLMVFGVAFGTSPLMEDSTGLLDQTRTQDLPMTGGFSIALVLLLVVGRGKFLRWKAAILIVAYLVWLVSVFLGS